MSGNIATDGRIPKGRYLRVGLGRLFRNDPDNIRKPKSQFPPAGHSKPYYSQSLQKSGMNPSSSQVTAYPEAQRSHPGTPTRSDAPYRDDLKEFCRHGITKEKWALECYADEVWQVLTFREKDEQAEAFTNATETLDGRLSKALDEQTTAAISYINELDENDRRPATDYWIMVSGQLTRFVDLYMQKYTKTIEAVVPFCDSIRDMAQEFQKDMDEMYNTTVTTVYSI